MSDDNKAITSSSDIITIKVKWTATNEDLEFKLKKETQFKKVIAALEGKFGLGRDSFRMVFDGSRIRDTDTPKMLELEDGDMIDALIEQQGGLIIKII